MLEGNKSYEISNHPLVPTKGRDGNVLAVVFDHRISKGGTDCDAKEVSFNTAISDDTMKLNYSSIFWAFLVLHCAIYFSCSRPPEDMIDRYIVSLQEKVGENRLVAIKNSSLDSLIPHCIAIESEMGEAYLIPANYVDIDSFFNIISYSTNLEGRVSCLCYITHQRLNKRYVNFDSMLVFVYIQRRRYPYSGSE